MPVKPEITDKRHMNDMNRYIPKIAELETANIRDGVNNNNEGCQDQVDWCRLRDMIQIGKKFNPLCERVYGILFEEKLLLFTGIC